MFLVSLIALTAVSAAENATDDIANADDGICEELDISTDEILTSNPTIADLNRTINNNPDSEITLNSDYTYTDSDSGFKEGIIINRDLTINGNGHTIDGGNSIRIFQITGGSVILKNLTFINGFIDNYGYGGAIFAQDGNVKAINCTFNNNHASYGGAVHKVNVVNCTFNSNTASFQGGAVYRGSAVNCTFNSNYADHGGAVASGSAVNCTFNSNHASISGGAIYQDHDNSEIHDCDFVNNSADKYGGAVHENSKNSKIYNCTFVNNNATNYGGAIYGEKDNCKIYNCTFVNNNATKYGGAVDLNGDNGGIYNCIFVNNAVNETGGAIDMFGQYNGVVSNCIFVNNTAKDGGIIYWYDRDNGVITNCVFINNNAAKGTINCNKSNNLTITRNIFLNNNGSDIYFTENDTISHINYNWFGNTAENYKNAPNTQNVTVDNWLFLNGTANPNPVSITKITNITFDFYSYNSTSADISKYDIGELKPIMTLTSTNGNIDKDIAKVGEVIKYNATRLGTDTVTAKIANITNTLEITVRDTTFNDLQELINNAEPGSTITLEHDYIYIDSDPTDGIIIDRDLIIDGNGHTINGTGSARIFKIIPRNVEFHNITFADGYTPESGAAIRIMDGGYCYAINCTFENNEAERGGAMYGGAAINCSFIGNEATYGGAAFGSEAIGCSFIDNDAEKGGAIYEGSAINCTFNNNHATNGGAIYQGMAENCTFNSNSAEYGGAIYGGSATQSTFNSNYAQYSGGAIYEIGGDGRIDKCDFINNTADEDNGGAIYVSENKFEIFNCNFINNTAEDSGGAIYSYKHNCKIYNSNFINNTAYSDDGGAIYVYMSDFEIFNCNFINNTANDDSGAIFGYDYDYGYNCKIYNSNFINNTAGSYGGAILWEGHNGEFSNCTFINNTAGSYGGAIHYNGGSREVSKFSNCTFINNTAGSYGGATHSTRGNSEFSNCNFINNTAGREGGAICWGGYNSEFSNCNFINNTAEENGGAIYSTGSNGEFSNCNFINNTAEKNGGAIDWDGDNGEFSNCNFINNTAILYGGAIYYYNEISTTFSNCNFINNRATDNESWSGAIACMGDNTRLSSCTFANNSAANGAAFSFTYGENFVVSKCIFINNKGVNGTMSYDGTEKYDGISGITINNNIFINNNGPDIYIAEEVYDYNADYNWFGNTADNYKNAPNTQNVTLDTWLFLNATANPDTLAALSSTDIIFKLYAYNSTSEEISEYNNAQLIPADMAITAYKGDLNVNTAHLGDKIKFTAKGTDASVTATIENVAYTVKLNVIKLDSNLSLESKEVAYGENVIIAPDYNSYATGKVNITLKGKKHNLTFTDLDLRTLILLVNVLPDEYNISAVYSGDDCFNNATANATLKVNKLTTQITSAPVTTVYNSAQYLIITLKDSTGKTINGAELTVNLNGNKAYTTDKNGQVKINVATLVPKTYTAKITFAGNDIYSGSAATAKVIVKKANAKITAKKKTFKKSLKVKKYTITLKSGKNPIKKVQVTIKIGKKTYKAKTNAKGKATFKIKKLNKKGTYKATIKFKGNKYYNKATKKVKITIK